MVSAKGSLRAWLVLALGVAIHIAFLASLHYHYLDRFFYVTAHAKGQAGPFFGIYQSGVNLRNGESIYANENYKSPKEIAVPYYHFYRYLPFVAYISAAVSAVLKPWPAYWVWIAVNEALLSVCIISTLRLRKSFGAAAVIAASFWLAYSPMYAELYMGQFCFAMAFMIFAMLRKRIESAAQSPGFVSLEEQESLPAAKEEKAVRKYSIPAHSHASLETMGGVMGGLSWIASLLLKNFTVLYTPTILKLGKKKLAAAGLTIVGITSAPYFAAHADDLRWFLHLNLHPFPPRLTGGCFGFAGFLRGVCNALAPSSQAAFLHFGFFDLAASNVPVVTVSAVILATSLYLTVKQRMIDPLGSIALWTLTFFLVFKDIWEYHYVMLIPLLVAFYLETRSKLVALLFLLLAVPTPFFLYDVATSEDPQSLWSSPLSIAHHAFKSVPTLIFYLWVAKNEWKRTLMQNRAGAER